MSTSKLLITAANRATGSCDEDGDEDGEVGIIERETIAIARMTSRQVRPAKRGTCLINQYRFEPRFRCPFGKQRNRDVFMLASGALPLYD